MDEQQMVLSSFGESYLEIPKVEDCVISSQEDVTKNPSKNKKRRNHYKTTKFMEAYIELET